MGHALLRQEAVHEAPPFRGDIADPLKSRLPSRPHVVEQGDELVPDPVAQEVRRRIGGVFPPRDTGLGKRGPQRLHGEGQERAAYRESEIPVDFLHAGKCLGPASAQQVEQPRLALVIPMVGREDDPIRPRHLGHPSIPCTARSSFEPRILAGFRGCQTVQCDGFEWQLPGFRRSADEGEVVGRVRAQSMVDMQDAESAIAQSGRMQQRHGVRTPGDGEPDHAPLPHALPCDEGRERLFHRVAPLSHAAAFRVPAVRRRP